MERVNTRTSGLVVELKTAIRKNWFVIIDILYYQEPPHYLLTIKAIIATVITQNITPDILIKSQLICL